MRKIKNVDELAKELGHTLLKYKLYCAVAESCTGGSLSAAITNIAGSSHWFDRGFITYTNQAKEDMLGVSGQIISTHGAVSEATACAMAEGAIANSKADVSVAITGVAGPGGGSIEKPVGTVWIAWAVNIQPAHAQCYLFKGDRVSIREQSVIVALEGMIQRCILR